MPAELVAESGARSSSSRATTLLSTSQPSRDLPAPRGLLPRAQAVSGLGVVALLLSLLLLEQPPGERSQLPVCLPTGVRQRVEVLPHSPGVHFCKIEVRLLVAQGAPALRAVVHDDRLHPGLAGTERRDHTEIECLTPALPRVEQRVGGLGALVAPARRLPLEVAPPEPPGGLPGEGGVGRQVLAQQVVERRGSSLRRDCRRGT